MNYLKQCTDRLLISINGYKTPQSVIDKLNKKYEVILGNPPYNGKAERSNRI